MVADIGEVKRHIKPKADSTLRNMRKDDLIKYIRCLENNYNTAVSFNENQARYIETLDAAAVVRCKDCKFFGSNDGFSGFVCKKHCGMVLVTKETFCSYGERNIST